MSRSGPHSARMTCCAVSIHHVAGATAATAATTGVPPAAVTAPAAQAPAKSASRPARERQEGHAPVHANAPSWATASFGAPAHAAATAVRAASGSALAAGEVAVPVAAVAMGLMLAPGGSGDEAPAWGTAVAGRRKADAQGERKGAESKAMARVVRSGTCQRIVVMWRAVWARRRKRGEEGARVSNVMC